ncbi:MAG: porin family protein [Bacteroidaceae bacterium]|nr:porin family protein [Bacteroidaceae bacterium]
MKKTFLALVAMMALSISTANAQLQWGLLAGTHLTKVNFSDDLEDDANANLKSKNMSGFYVGPKVNFTIPIAGLGADAAIVYSQKKLNVEAVGSSSKTFRSIEIPINLRYTFGLSSLAAVYVATGPQFGFNVGNRKWDFSSVDNGLESVKFKKQSMNTSWNIGAGVKLVGHLEVGLLYNIAISKFYKKAGSDDYDFKANSFQIQAAYLF